MVSFKDVTIISYDITEKEKDCSKRISKSFYNREKLEKIKPIINQEDEISLRLIDQLLLIMPKNIIII